MAAGSNRFHPLWWAVLALLLALRLPSLAQPAGADQSLYAYVGQRLLAGDVPYRDAWDQKPPGIHVAYAAMMAVWPDHAVVAATDMAAAALTTLLLGRAAATLTGGAGAGLFTAALYLLLANPSFTRLGGVRIRAQCETFVGLLMATAIAILAARLARGGAIERREALGAGLCLGLAVIFKYNAAVYALPLALAVAVTQWPPRHGWRDAIGAMARPAAWMALGALAPAAAVLVWFGLAGALTDLYLATITYNLRYSGETYASRWHMLQYLVTFPIRHARLDSLWMLGGAGTAVLLIAAWGRPALALVPAWVAAACLSIAVNGSRGLPQYFVQAWPPLALAAGVGAAVVWTRLPVWGRWTLVALTLAAVPRVTQFDKMLQVTAVDARRLAGGIDRGDYLLRFGRPDSGDKYSARAVDDLVSAIEARTAPADTILVFGFSPWAYVGSGRQSASRFFWSRPVIIGFEAGRPGYGVQGLLDDMARRRPRLVALQARDWDPDGPNSLDFFRAEPRLSAWLDAHYVPAGTVHNFHLWTSADPK